MSEEITKDFISTYKFRNSLPSAPIGPFFKKIPILTSLEDQNQACTIIDSSLEKNYKWEPSFGDTLGLTIDLVDSKAIFAPAANSDDALYPEDKKFLSISSNNTRETRAKIKNIKIDNENRPWWLRNTTYLENNPFYLKQKEGELMAEKQEEANKLNSTKVYDESFTEIDETVEKLKNYFKDKKKLVSNMPILPLLINPNETASLKRSHSLVRFYDNPSEAISIDEVTKKKKFKISDSILLNNRPSKVEDNYNDISLVAPPITSSSSSNVSHEWVRDYSMAPSKVPKNSTFAFLVDREKQVVKYISIDTLYDLKKLNPEYEQPTEAIVTRD